MRFKVNWSKSGRLIHHEESEPLATFDEAMALALQKKPHNKAVTISKEGTGVNKGRFFLDFIVK